MSTKFSMFYKNDGEKYLHFYSDMADLEYHIEKEQKIITKLSLNLEEVCSIAKSINLSELERQANLSDEQMLAYVKSCLSICSRKNVLEKMWAEKVFGAENLTEEEKINNAFLYYKKIRDDLYELYKKVSESKYYSIDFGLSEIK